MTIITARLQDIPGRAAELGSRIIGASIWRYYSFRQAPGLLALRDTYRPHGLMHRLGHGDATCHYFQRLSPTSEAAGVTDDEVAHIARLLSQRNAIDDTIAAVIQRLMAAGHLGEWIAAQVFDIELEQSAVSFGSRRGRHMRPERREPR